MWENLVTPSCQFARFLTMEDSRVCGEKAIQMGKICMSIKQGLNHERLLLILRATTISGLGDKKLIKKLTEGNWEGEIQRKLGDSINGQKYVDIMLPIRVSSQWVLLVIDFAQRTTKFICFKREAFDLPLDKLVDLATKIWKAAANVGVRTMGGNVFVELQNDSKWKFSKAVIAKSKGEEEK